MDAAAEVPRRCLESGGFRAAGSEPVPDRLRQNDVDFLESVYLAGADLSGTELEHQAKCIEQSHKMLCLVDSAVDLMRAKHKNGEEFYWLLYYSYLSPQELQNVEEIIDQLRPHIRDISPRTYYRKRKEAVEVLSSVLWGYTAQDSTGIVREFLQ